ncbi:MAG: hypothetical protein ACK5XQ_03120 [Flavobacteriales bacterium]
MIYSFNTLTTIAACDELINEYGREKTAMLNRKNNLLQRLENGNTTTNVADRIAFLEQRIASHQALLADNPPEEDLQEMQIELGDMIKERGTLVRRMGRLGEHWAIDATLQINSCDSEIALRDALIAEITAHRATLPAEGSEAA